LDPDASAVIVDSELSDQKTKLTNTCINRAGLIVAEELGSGKTVVTHVQQKRRRF
jgi:tagatose-1,6-bisphosphate aldolase